MLFSFREFLQLVCKKTLLLFARVAAELTNRAASCRKHCQSDKIDLPLFYTHAIYP